MKILDEIITPRQMKQHVDDGWTDERIAGEYHVSTSAVYRYRREHAIMKHKTKVGRDVDTYYRMKECKLTDASIAFIWNMSRRCLSEWKKREGIDGTKLKIVLNDDYERDVAVHYREA